ncbi:putative holin [Paraburkholderia hayleyella]|uniref:putative holin n=1 Tax=Paraburkholderia hayleyella TaxID=2152889 RepID=UPI00129106CB|nr:putative holin [Paraburkholderia hayleyella]
MAEPNTTALIISKLTVGMARLAPGVDGNALIGAFAGAALVVVTSKDLGIFTRVVHMLISFVMGYVAAGEIVNQTPIGSTGVAAFFAAALVIAVTLQLLERVKTLDLLSMFKKRG